MRDFCKKAEIPLFLDIVGFYGRLGGLPRPTCWTDQRHKITAFDLRISCNSIVGVIHESPEIAVAGSRRELPSYDDQWFSLLIISYHLSTNLMTDL